MRRRDLLLLSTAAALVPLGGGAWAAPAAVGPRPGDSAGQRLVVVLLRGAVDGLNVVIPYGEQAYYAARPNIAVAREAALDLDGFFGVHPSLASLLPYFKDKSLGFVHAVGSPDSTRSHFDAQDFMESGTPGVKVTEDGFL